MEFAFLKTLIIIFGTSALVVFFLGKLKIPSVVGFLVAGIIVGPYSLNLVADIDTVENIAELGVVLLLFTIGLEFSVRNLIKLRSVVLGGGLLQVLMTTGGTALLTVFALHQNLNQAVFNGFLVSLSSSAIVLKTIFDWGEIHTPHGRVSLGILLFQDLCVVPLMLFIPVLSGAEQEIGNVVLTLFKALAMVAAVLFMAKWVVPAILHQVVSLRMPELFVMAIILLSIGTALLTALLGLSLALGAFLAGVVISESEYASQAMSDILPFKESFTGLFFVSIGMLMDLSFFRTNILLVLSAVMIIIVAKSLTISLATLTLGYSLRTALQTGLYLSQIGEFSFVLAVAGKAVNLITEEFYQLFLSASILTMLLTPLLMKGSSPLSVFLSSGGLLQRLDRNRVRGQWERYPEKITGHVIIIGCGVNGRNLARVLRESGIPYVILEFNIDIVREMKKKGEPIYYGDGTRLEILQRLRIEHAQVVVAAISDAAATRRITQLVRRENPDLHVIVRTRYTSEVDDLIRLGANEVIPEEFETSVEIFSRVLHHYHVPINLILEHTDHIRENSYKVLRRVELPKKHLGERTAFLQDIESEIYLIGKGAAAHGQALMALDLRANTGATIIAVQRKSKVFQNPPPDFVLKEGDAILLIGRKKEITSAMDYLERGHPVSQGPESGKSEGNRA